MATERNPIRVLIEAKQIAKDHGLFVVERSGEYLLYRQCNPDNVRVGKSKSPDALRRLVCRVTGFR